jgi:hypothetical protein
VIEGAAPAGSVLRVKKVFTTVSSPVCSFAQGLLVAGGPLAPLDCVAPGATQSTKDGLDYTMVVPASNRYEWHVTPSTRPFVARKVTPGGYASTAYKTEAFEPTAKDVPSGDRGTDDPQGLVGSEEKKYSAERRFTLDPSEAGNRVVVDLNWDVPAQDFDLKLYHVAGDGSLQPAGVGTGATGGSAGGSGEPNGLPEQISVDKAEAGDYVARVIYYLTGAQQVAPANDWHMKVSRFANQPDKVESGKEYWTMSCESAGGQVLESKDIYVERGQTVTADFACGGTAPPPSVGGTGNVTPQGDVRGERVARRSKPATRPQPKRVGRRTVCLRNANRIRSKSRRKAAVKLCNRRYPTRAR